MPKTPCMHIGVYTGFSLLATILALPVPDDGKNYEIGLPVIEKAGYHGTFDFVFMDADKSNCMNYHMRLIDLVKVCRLIGYDNTLWNGPVAVPTDTPMANYIRNNRDFVIELNSALAVDPMIEICMLSVGDGVTLCPHIS
ncbi:hypothetical protein DCAR_0417736 [Daucus carota subsp. sativus]|uniref:caffeoyl-CoA O-methyltransferase n=1 Tax=Daucus carota subsp. sativus TaxID=79200 RepID=A0AAF0X297_DAUCS|nr:hypothetical protein DCAR_0417736 [Daucus carota subsp. sativus]